MNSGLATIHDLPNEVYKHILGFTDVQTIFAINETSKRCRELVKAFFKPLVLSWESKENRKFVATKLSQTFNKVDMEELKAYVVLPEEELIELVKEQESILVPKVADYFRGEFNLVELFILYSSFFGSEEGYKASIAIYNSMGPDRFDNENKRRFDPKSDYYEKMVVEFKGHKRIPQANKRIVSALKNFVLNTNPLTEFNSLPSAAQKRIMDYLDLEAVFALNQTSKTCHAIVTRHFVTPTQSWEDVEKNLMGERISKIFLRVTEQELKQAEDFYDLPRETLFKLMNDKKRELIPPVALLFSKEFELKELSILQHSFFEKEEGLEAALKVYNEMGPDRIFNRARFVPGNDYYEKNIPMIDSELENIPKFKPRLIETIKECLSKICPLNPEIE